jgi:hypothetical protein
MKAISNQQSAISNQQSAISNQQSAISNQQSAISNQPVRFLKKNIHRVNILIIIQLGILKILHGKQNKY